MGKYFISQMCYKNKYTKNYKIPRNIVICVRYILQIGGKKVSKAKLNVFADSHELSIQMPHSRSPARAFLQEQGMPASLCQLLFIYSEWLQHLGIPSRLGSELTGAAGCSCSPRCSQSLNLAVSCPSSWAWGAPSTSDGSCCRITTSGSHPRQAQAASGHCGATRCSWRFLCASSSW